MKFKLLSLVALSTALFTSGSFEARGGDGWDGGEIAAGEVSGGGTAFFKDGKLQLADPFLVRKGEQGEAPDLGTRVALSKEHRDALLFLGKLLTRYGAEMTAPTELFAESRFVQESILNPDVEYRLVTAAELAKLGDCESDGEYRLPDGAKPVQLACTRGLKTFLVEELFKQLSSLDQIKAILHERTHALPVFPSEEHIANLTDGAGALMTLAAEQRNLNSPTAKRLLKPEEVLAITRMMKSIVALQLNPGKAEEGLKFIASHSIAPLGGGLVAKDAKGIHPSVLIGVGSIVGPNAVIQADAALVDTTACQVTQCKLSEKVTLFNVTVSAGVLKVGALGKIENSRLVSNAPKYRTMEGYSGGIGFYYTDHSFFEWGQGAGRIQMEANSQIVNTDLTSGALTLGSDAQISQVQLRNGGCNVTLGDGAAIDHVKFRYRSMDSAGYLSSGGIRMFLAARSRLMNVDTALSLKEGKCGDVSTTDGVRVMWENIGMYTIEIPQAAAVDFNNQPVCGTSPVKGWKYWSDALIGSSSGVLKMSSPADLRKNCPKEHKDKK